MHDKESSLYEAIFDRATTDANLTDRATELVLAAIEGDEELDAAISGTRHVDERPAVKQATPAPDMFLSAIRVEGFRGIGPASTLPLTPGPGLTLITGRNGSGKSSFAEAVELAITGDSMRWSGKKDPALWRGGWRNLHASDIAEITVELTTVGDQGSASVRKTWQPGSDLDGAAWTYQPSGQKRRPHSANDWRTALDLYRPFLSYDELGSFLDSRKCDLYDALNPLLGLGPITEATNRLKARRGARDKRQRELTTSKQRLETALAEVADERARQAQQLLSAPSPVLGELSELILGNDDQASELSALRAIAQLTLPTRDDLRSAAGEITAATDAIVTASAPAAVSAGAVADLLTAAMAYHDEHGETPCPVCDTGRLDIAWRTSAIERCSDATTLATALRAAHDRLRAAVDAARRIVQPVPSILHRAPAGIDAAPAVEAWKSWWAAGQVTEPGQIIEALRSAHAPLDAALGAVRSAAKDALRRLDEKWRPVSKQLEAWHDEAVEVAAGRPLLKEIKSAIVWLTSTEADLRQDRLAPIAEEAQRVWGMLRQQSCVDLAGISLQGSNNSRRVELDVALDGAASTALSVMSQGELHALGLALFLPRATAEASPFRFLVIDDPVQAMDPAKVDGLANLLADLAETRQIIVFSHDDRLAEAVRRLPHSATVWEVQRRDGSQVELARTADPVARYLSDARALAHTTELPNELRRELVATCCRSAVDAAAHAKVRSVRLARGDSHEDVEKALSAARNTGEKVSLAIFDEARSSQEVQARLQNQVGSRPALALKLCKIGAHVGLTGDLHGFIKDVERLAAGIQP